MIQRLFLFTVLSLTQAAHSSEFCDAAISGATQWCTLEKSQIQSILNKPPGVRSRDEKEKLAADLIGLQISCRKFLGDCERDCGTKVSSDKTDARKLKRCVADGDLFLRSKEIADRAKQGQGDVNFDGRSRPRSSRGRVSIGSPYDMDDFRPHDFSSDNVGPPPPPNRGAVIRFTKPLQ